MPPLSSITVQWPDQTAIAIYANTRSPVLQEVDLGMSGAAKVSGTTTNSPPAAQELWSLSFTPDPDEIFQPIRLLEETEYQVVVTLPFSKSDCIDQYDRSTSKSWPFHNQQISRSVQVVLPRLWFQAGANSTQIPIIFNGRSQAGTIDLSLDAEHHRLLAEVMTGKISYESEFKLLLNSIADYQIQLSYEIGASSGLALRPANMPVEDLLTVLFHLRRLMGTAELPAAMEAILNSPLDSVISVESLGKNARSGVPRAAHISRRLASLSLRPGGPLAECFGGFTPEALPHFQKIQTLDIAENQYVKHFLLTLEHLLLELEEACRAENKRNALEEVQRWTASVQDWLSHDLWREIGDLTSFPSNSQRLQRSTAYQDVFAANFVLQEALALPWMEMNTHATMG